MMDDEEENIIIMEDLDGQVGCRNGRKETI